MQDWSLLLTIKKIIENDRKYSISYIEQLEKQQEEISTYKIAVFNMIVDNRTINSDSISLLETMISKYNLDIVLDRDDYAKKLGAYYMYPTENNRDIVRELLIPYLVKMHQLLAEFDIDAINKKIKKLTYLIDDLDNLLNYSESNYHIPIGEKTLATLLKYISFIPSDVLSDEQKTLAIYQFNLVNLDALKRRVSLICKKYDEKKANDNSAKKAAFENENKTNFEEIEKIVTKFKKFESNLTEVEKNQINTINQNINIELLDDDILISIEEMINNIGANFDVDFYVKYMYFQMINDWYDIYNKLDEENDYLSCYNEIQLLISKYHVFLDRKIENEKTMSVGEANDLMFLADSKNQFVGIEQIIKDNHDYDESSYRDLLKGFKTIRNASRDYLQDATCRVKKAGIPGIPESKFRRLRSGSARIIYVDINNFIANQFNRYFQNQKPCFLIITFGQKNGEVDIYDSVNSSISTRIPNILIDFRRYLNAKLQEIINATTDETERQKEITNFMNKMIKSSNELFTNEFVNMTNSCLKVSDGGLKNA